MRLLLVAGFLLLEGWLLARAVQALGGWPVALWTLLTAALGLYVIRRQGLATLRLIQQATTRGELPAREWLEGLLLFAAGLLLVLPGLLLDAVALGLLLSWGLRRRLGARLYAGMARSRPDLRQPVTLEGEYRHKP
ncbi:MAG: FxsA family protein [Gammaproteobacteria bacterium]|jgi:UPF0716 protein FxsA